MKKTTGLSAAEDEPHGARQIKGLSFEQERKSPFVILLSSKGNRNINKADIVLHYLLTSEQKKYLFNTETMIFTEIF